MRPMFREFIIRIGTFLILIGIGMFILFLASDSAKQANFDYLFWAVLAFTIGILLRRLKPAPPPSGRFESLRRWTGRGESDDKDGKPR